MESRMQSSIKNEALHDQNGKSDFTIGVIDGKGGGIGQIIIERLRQEMGHKCYIIALGTNAAASSNMLKAGANQGASGENAILTGVVNLNIIVGSVAILAAHSFSGELTPRMAEAIASAQAQKILLPVNNYQIDISGIFNDPLPVQADLLASRVRMIYRQRKSRQDWYLSASEEV